MEFLNQIKNKIHSSWKNFINNKEVLKELEKIEEEIGNNYYPKTKDNESFATRRSFEVNGYNSWMEKIRKSSLTNILKGIYLSATNKKSTKVEEVRKEIANNNFNILPPNELFDNLEKQGVLFLNYGLTVDKNKSGSHLLY